MIAKEMKSISRQVKQKWTSNYRVAASLVIVSSVLRWSRPPGCVQRILASLT